MKTRVKRGKRAVFLSGRREFQAEELQIKGSPDLGECLRLVA